MIKKAPTIFPLYWEDKEQALTAQRDADHQYYLKQFVEWAESICSDHHLAIQLWRRRQCLECWQALSKEAGG